MAAIVRISTLKKGDYFKKVTTNGDLGNKVYTFKGKVRIYSNWGKFKGWGFHYVDNDDVWGTGFDIAKDISVSTDFEY